MKSSSCWLILFGVVLIQNSLSVPVSNLSSDNELANNVEDEEEEEENEEDVFEDDFTTHGLERLSSAATCLVGGVEYTHGQQIYRKHPCEFCLCLDGEMFCWWQDCPLTIDGPCRDRGPFSPCLSIPGNPLAFGSSSLLSASLSSATSQITRNTNIISSSSTAKPLSSKKAPNSFSEKIIDTTTKQTISIKTSSRPPESSTFSGNKYCTVMGREYQIGDKLPHDTGNCLECICGQGAKVTCSPHQCAPVEDDMNDYHMSGSRQQVVSDIF